MDSACAASPGGTCNVANTSSDLVAYAAAVVSVMGLATILLLQMDGVSRRLLSPPRLLAKRRQEYQYAVTQSCEYNTLMMRQHVGGGKGKYNPRSESTVWETLTVKHNVEMDDIVATILDVTKPTPVIVALEQDLTDECDPDTYYLFLAFPTPGSGVSTPGPPKLHHRMVRVPLLVFCELLATAFAGQMTSVTLCFVADASSGLGSEILTTVVKRCNHGVAILSSPAWMNALSLLICKNISNISTQQFERMIFALCRLDAWRVRDSIGASRTVLFSLPGQSCVPLLLPLIQKVFVHDRHVFVYDGCCPSVEFGTALRVQYGSSYRQQAANENWDEVSASPKVITSNFPMAPLRHIRELPGTLAMLNGTQASIVENWMASVDTFLDMKSKEKKNMYAPFVCQMSFLMKRSAFGKSEDVSEMALKNVLQYITGSKSRALPSAVMSEAASCLTEIRCKFEEATTGSKLSVVETALIEACVFTHKAILLGDKTLIDTVQPKEDWSLKAAKKMISCLCCIPDGEEDEDGDGESSKPNFEMDLSEPRPPKTVRSKYMDGKTQFAFDPTMFNN